MNDFTWDVESVAAAPERTGFKLLDKGDYDYEVLSAESGVSGTGNPQIKLKINVLRPNGTGQWVYDYVGPAMPHKLKHFVESLGLSASAGKLDLGYIVGMAGKVTIGIEPAKGSYDAKNKVVDYIPRAGGASGAPAAVTAAPGNILGNDSIPF